MNEDINAIYRKRRRRGVAGTVVAAVLGLVTAAALVLGNRTLLGWAILAAALAGFFLLRKRIKAPRRALKRLACWAGLVALLVAAVALSKPPYRVKPAVEGQTGGVTAPVTVAQGTLTGVLTADGAVEVYAGIPYAAPPVGENRWRPPQPAEPWEGVRACDAFAPRSMQPESSAFYDAASALFVYHNFRYSPLTASREARSEDSLYLNIWKPAGAQEQDKLPVLVYIHGGSLTTGQAGWADYNGEPMARDGIIVVNFAYRLGVFGYYAGEQLAAEDPNGTTGNYGLLDQIAALQWVHDNIARFGGDPDAVTICGESAGASSVNALCVSPLSEGLFRRAIAESSGITAKVPYHTFRSMEKALETGRQILEEFDCADVEALRQVPAEQLVDTKHANNSMTVDGWAITEMPYLTYEKGENHEEALLSGFNTHEADIFNLTKRVDDMNYYDVLAAILGEDGASEVVHTFPKEEQDPAYRIPIAEAGGSAKGSANKAYSAAWFTYSHYNWSRYLAAQGRKCWEYCFSKYNGSLAANHAGELPYVFGNVGRLGGRYDASDYALSETMRAYWVNFVKTGDPNGPGLPEWRQFAEDETQVMGFGETVGMTGDPFFAYYRLIDAYQNQRAKTA